ncbi:MAG: GNAT family N-acetyltransferase [Clostridia bacterium]|nr:GNAT family N-acetyltransferase [Clostridia bacterium]
MSARRLPIVQLTRRYELRFFTEGDLPKLLDLCLGNPLYYAHLGEEVTLDSLRDELTVLPKGKELCDKYFFGLYNAGKLVAAIDLIDGYPEEDVAYLGWLILAAERQGRGEGTAIVQELTDFLRKQGFRAVRLACVVGNPQSARFWEKNGLVPDGKSSERERCSVIELERVL